MSLSEELDEKIGSKLKMSMKELASPEQEVKDDVYYEHFDEFHFAVAMFVVKEEETIELEFEDAECYGRQKGISLRKLRQDLQIKTWA